MEYKINNAYKVSDTQEISVDARDFNFFVIYGRHINGWVIAIPNHNVCIEAAHPRDEVFYNMQKLSAAADIKVRNASAPIANAVKKHWQGLQK